MLKNLVVAYMNDLANYSCKDFLVPLSSGSASGRAMTVNDVNMGIQQASN
jgi:hypothetical protein